MHLEADIGTSAVKLVSADIDRILASSSVGSKMSSPQPGWSEPRHLYGKTARKMGLRENGVCLFQLFQATVTRHSVLLAWCASIA